MGKFKQYGQKFRSEGLNDDLFKKWPMPVSGDDTEDFCKYLNVK